MSLIDESQLPKGWGSTSNVQREARAWADEAFGGDFDLKTVFKKAYIEMREVADELAKEEVDQERVAKDVADVVLALMLIGSMLKRDIGILVRRKVAINSGRIWEKKPDGTWQHKEKPDAEKVRK